MKTWGRTCVLAAACLPGFALACCIAYGDQPIAMTDEKVIIIWNEDKGMQHFIRQASFDGKAKDFGFIVPTPTVPEVKDVDEAAFETLGRVVVDGQRSRWELKGADSAAAPAGGVEVIDEFRVGDYQAAIIKAERGSDIVAWLDKNGYNSRPAMTEWLDHYAKRKWIFTALKFVRDPKSNTQATTALRISFPTKQPHYPYMMPKDTWPPSHRRSLSLFVIAEREAKATYEVSQSRWIGEKQWSGKLPSYAANEICDQLKLSPSDLPANAVLTGYVNNEPEVAFDQDLVFTTHALMMPLWGTAGAVVGAGGVLFWRLRRKPTP